MPKQVDHEGRRRELAEATCRVVARAGADGVSLRMVARESGWSIGSIRHYFSTKSELVAFACDHLARRIEERATALPSNSDLPAIVRHFVEQLLPLDDERRMESRIFLAFGARAMIDADTARTQAALYAKLHDVLRGVIAIGIEIGMLRPELDPDLETLHLQAVVDGLFFRAMTTPADDLPPDRIRAILDHHLAALVAPASYTALATRRTTLRP
jgi:AcrR family transcriptional regulator